MSVTYSKPTFHQLNGFLDVMWHFDLSAFWLDAGDGDMKNFIEVTSIFLNG
jgi:hypothetical protein